MHKFQRFLRRAHEDSEARKKLQKELFAFNRTGAYGFPAKPSALAWDPELKLLAIGTSTGELRIYGAPGVEYHAEVDEEIPIKKALFIPNQGRLLTVLEDNSIQLWEINSKNDKAVLEIVRQNKAEKNWTAYALSPNGEQLLLGAEDGNVYTLQLPTLALDEQFIAADTVSQSAPDTFKLNPGAVEGLAFNPKNADKLLVGYSRGLVAVWNRAESKVECSTAYAQQLESLCWNHAGDQVMSAHNDGSLGTWHVTDSSKVCAPNIPYGPFPCKPINRVLWKSAGNKEAFIIFAGGMPRATYGDKNAVTVQQGNKQVALDFTSKVIDFLTINELTEDADNPQSLFVLLEEELVAIDLNSDGWPPYELPYLTCMHSSAVTSVNYVSNVPADIMEKIRRTPNNLNLKYSQKEWPVKGGQLTEDPNMNVFELLITGHEDGSVRFWDVSTVCLRLVATIATAHYFTGEEAAQAQDDLEDWPAFRKVGLFDPYSDDPRLAVQRVILCPASGHMAIAGTAGQVIVFSLNDEDQTVELKSVSVNIVSDRDNFVWKGHEPLVLKTEAQFAGAGFQPNMVIQLSPPAAVTALALHAEWKLITVGTAHGFGLIDYARVKQVVAKCTLSPGNVQGTSDAPLSRRKSFKKSLRESFRRIRKVPSFKKRRQPSKPEGTAEGETKAEDGKASPRASPMKEQVVSIETKPVERQVEAREHRPADELIVSMVRCLYFAETFIAHGGPQTPTLWAGTNSGAIYIYQMTMPAAEKRNDEDVQCMLAKELQLKHRAPVQMITVIDSKTAPLPNALEVAQGRAKPADMTGNHKVIICSEEQFKIFQLPQLKPLGKFKLTAFEGARVRKIAIVNFVSKSDDNYSENCVACLSNLGELSVYTIPGLRRQVMHPCIKKEDINGIASFLFSPRGEGFYLQSSSEFARVTLSARVIVEPRCRVQIEEGNRPPLPVEQPVETKEEPPAEAAANALNEVKEEAGVIEEPETKLVEESPKKTSAEEVTDKLEKTDLNESNPCDHSADITIDSVKDHTQTGNGSATIEHNAALEKKLAEIESPIINELTAE